MELKSECSHLVVIQHEEDSFELDQLADTAVPDRQITQQLQCFRYNQLWTTPVFQIRYSVGK